MDWALALTLAEIVWVVGIAIFIALEGRPPAATIAWILGLALLPYIGIVVYWLLGPRRLRRRKLRLLDARRVIRQAAGGRGRAGFKGAPLEPLIQLGHRLGGFPVLGAHSIALFTEGDAKYDALLAAIRAARHHVHLEYYIFDDDETGGPLLDALAERARAGVAVRILADAVGSHVSRARRRALREAGVQFRWFNRTALSRLRRRIANFRTHRKIAVVDGAIGFTGGMNLYRAHSARVKGAEARRDTHLRLEGEAVRALQLTFLENWAFARRERFGASDLADYFPDLPAGETPVQIVPSGPDQLRPAIYSFYLAAIGKATRRVWLTAPYFVPDESLCNALALAATRGVDVKVLLPERSDWRLVDAAGASTHDTLRRAGVRVLLQSGPLLHAKIALIDDAVGIVGTANIDDRSMKLNFEVIAACYDRGIVEALERQFLAEAARARIKTEFEAKAPFLRRLAVAGARLLAPQL